MLLQGAQLNSTTISGGGFGDHHQASNNCRQISSSHCYSSTLRIPYFSLQDLSSNSWRLRRCFSRRRLNKSAAVISCKSSFGSSNLSDNNSDDDYVEAIILISETISHYRMLMHGFQEETSWKLSPQLGPFSDQWKDPRSQVNSVGSGFLRRFQSPTIFLKISCDGDFVLPIIVGEYAVGKLIDSFHEDEREDCPNQFQLTRNLMETLGYQVKMVKITERVINTYFARIIFHKPGEMNVFSLDARPSDAINIAKRCKAPIYVNKQIVLTDATRVLYGMTRTSNKSTYDVSLDSAADGPDLLTEELNLVRNMNLAAKEERYSDAAMWRDKLMKLRESENRL